MHLKHHPGYYSPAEGISNRPCIHTRKDRKNRAVDVMTHGHTPSSPNVFLYSYQLSYQWPSRGVHFSHSYASSTHLHSSIRKGWALGSLCSFILDWEMHSHPANWPSLKGVKSRVHCALILFLPLPSPSSVLHEGYTFRFPVLLFLCATSSLSEYMLLRVQSDVRHSQRQHGGRS